MRSQKELIQATAPFAVEDRFTTWRLLATTGLVFGLAFAAVLAVPAHLWPLKLLPSVVLGLTWVRVFIFFHDWLHKAIFLKSPLGNAVMTAFGLITLVPPSVWQQTHDYHHQNNAKMVGASIGSYPVVTVGMYHSLPASQQFWYRVARNPLVIVFAYFTLFLGGMIASAFKRSPKEHWMALPSLVLHVALLGGLAWGFGAVNAFFGYWFPLALACAAGGYLFYAQHNFPSIKLKGRRDWNYAFAALRSSSYFEMSPLMHWFTGNIGYHHVHHLNHRIPFYRLAEAMAAVPELQDPGRTSWRPSDVWGCLRLKLWDPDGDRMVTWAEAEQIWAAKQASAPTADAAA